MSWEPWVSTGSAAVSAVFAGVSLWQAQRSKVHEANAARAAQRQTRAIEKQEAREQGRLYIEKVGPRRLRVWNPGFDDIDRIEIESVSLPNHSTALGTINPGEFKDLELGSFHESFDRLTVLLFRHESKFPDRHTYSLVSVGFTSSTK